MKKKAETRPGTDVRPEKNDGKHEDSRKGNSRTRARFEHDSGTNEKDKPVQYESEKVKSRHIASEEDED